MKTIGLIVTLLFSLSVFGQGKVRPIEFDNKNSVQFDLGGHGMFYSLNYERILFNGDRFKTTAQVGIAYYPPSWGYIELWLPIGINEIFSMGNNHIEFAVGIVPNRSPLPFTDLNMDIYDLHSPWSSFLSARVGYRYQKPDGKFLFRAGFTPLAEGSLRAIWQPSNLSIYPLVGVSFGYSF